MALICVSLAESTAQEVVRISSGLKCDAVEARIDHFTDPLDQGDLSLIRQPVIATCMPCWEGGKYVLGEKKRMSVLELSLEYASYVSIELDTEISLRDALIEKAKDAGVKVILSHHDFTKTPDTQNMVETLLRQRDAGADIGKIAYMPNSIQDALNVISAQVSCGLEMPVIAHAMGEMGAFTRICGPMLGGYLAFAACGEGKKTAKGQYTLSQMLVFRDMLFG